MIHKTTGLDVLWVASAFVLSFTMVTSLIFSIFGAVAIKKKWLK